MSMPYYRTEAPRLLSSALIHEADFRRSREDVVVLAGAGAARELELGAVIARRRLDAATVAAKVGNTGTGALSAVLLGPSAKVGVYTLTCVSAGANAGLFAVIDPDGYRLSDAVVGVAYRAKQIGFSLADGAVDFVVGDVFTITVVEGDGKVTALDPTATDGRQLAAGFLTAAVVAPDGSDAPAQAIVREAVAAADGLVWPAGITDAAKSAALADLRDLGVLVR